MHLKLEEEKKIVGFEIVDVLIYLIQIANKSKIDIGEMLSLKIPLLEKKFPVGIGDKALERHKEYREKGLNKLYE